jgi:Tfp pilus assembly protein PilF
LGSYHDSQGDWTAAVAAYDKALAERPNNAMILNNRGFSNFMQGNMDEAIADLQRALRLDPKLQPARVNLRLAHAWTGHYLHALSGATDKELPEVLNNIGYVAMMRGDLDNAEAYLQRAMEADPGFNEKAWNNLAQLRQMRQLTAEEREELPPVTPKDITAAVTGE